MSPGADRAADQPCTVEAHLRRVLDAVAPLPLTPVALADCLGLVLAEDVRSTIPLPSFDNSAMDGYAVRRADVVGASASAPVSLPVVGGIGAGQSADAALEPGTATKIMTGARVPAGADSIVPYEWTDRGAQQVRISESPTPGQHVRTAGDDVAVGDLLLEAGTVLGPRQVGLLAAVGLATAPVRRRPVVAVLSTGSELRDPGESLGPDSIYDANSFMLAAAVERAGGTGRRVGTVTDRAQAFLDVLSELGDVDLVITSGGVSQGDYDVVKEALRPRGVWFGPVAMQPGKPQGFGVLTGLGAVDGTPIVTLPGNPVSSYLSFRVFVLPALRTMLGLEPDAAAPVTARLTQATTSPAGRRQFLRARLVARSDPAGEQEVELVGGPASHLVGALALAECLVVVPEDVTEVAAGSQVAVLMLDEAR